MGCAKTRGRLGGDRGEASLAPPIHTEPDRYLEPLQTLQAQPAESGFELPSEVMGVVLPALEHDSRPSVGRQRLARGRGELGQMLVEQGQAPPAAARRGP